ncbi:MAG TPA: hypothetical protein PLD47_02345 [Aggregatilineales bacterium]|nr:hypothetical protein [Anaerolineales bacterium]HRE46539.1 hypothetical protein [Aggregatilineales bacterium]
MESAGSGASAHQAITILTWFFLTALAGFLLLIARQYQREFGERTFFWAFALPPVLIGIGAARYAFTDQAGGDPLGDLTSGVGLFLFAIFSCLLTAQMLRSKDAAE